MLTAQSVVHAHDAPDHVTLIHADRSLRRRVLVSDSGVSFLVDLPRVRTVGAGDAFRLDDGRLIGVRPADEALIEVTGPDLARLAWHIGNRHMPCQVEPGRLLIQSDHVLHDMLDRLGASLRAVTEPFAPEGGAYEHGHGHSHAH